MKKLTIKLKYDEIMELDSWMGFALHEMAAENFADKSVKALLYEWYTCKLKMKIHFRFSGSASFKLNTHTALALAHLIQNTPINTSSYLGRKLLEVLGDIDKKFQ